MDSPGQGCQQIRQPVCNAAPGGSCNPGTQQCCSTSSQRVCRNVPQLERTMVSRPVPGNVFWKEECKMVDYNVTKERYSDRILHCLDGNAGTTVRVSRDTD